MCRNEIIDSVDSHYYGCVAISLFNCFGEDDPESKDDYESRIRNEQLVFECLHVLNEKKNST